MTMTKEISLARVAFLRSVANRLTEVINALSTKPEEGVTAARELLEDLYKALPRESLAELTSIELASISGCLVEVRDRLDLGIFLKEDEYNHGDGLVLMSGTKTVEAILLNSVYPRWDLPALLPDNGIPRETTRDSHPVTSFTPEPESKPAKASEPESPSAPGNREELSDNEEFIPVAEEEFYELPNKSLVRVIDQETGQEIVGTRTRKGRWALSNVAKPVNDVEAWEILLDASEDEEVYLLIVSE